ncbi:RNA-directed DNA polymerase, eukaryota, reverse transcriptase zinc-binding domain protein [Tanacetum coccineum]
MLSACPNLYAVLLDRFLSDHRPILMREHHGDYGPTPFKFFHYWFEIEGFDKFVEESWIEIQVNDQNQYSKFMKKLKLLKEKIRVWIKIYKESTKSGKRTLNSELVQIDSKIDRGEGSDSDINRRHEVIRLIQDIEKVDTLEMAQKAKIKWAIEGDENSKYFHRVINKKRGRFTVRGVMANGTWLDSPNSVKMEFFEHFKIDLINLVFVVFNFNSYLRDILGDILGKDIVNEIQSAFVADRQILDGPFILNELVQWCKAKKKQTMVFKVDFEKAYDSVRWDFLNDVMKKFGFGEKWCNWIRKCLQTSRGSVLVNGSPTQEFQFYKGLKQGDPLLPFLFILVMESLHTSFQRVVEGGFFKGIKLNSSLYMSHLFYADDVIFMGQWNQDNIDTLIRVLDVFYRASGLRINMSKSKLLGISVETSKMEQAATKIGCSMLKTPFMYLGARVGDQMSRINAWKEIMMVLQNMEAIRARFFNGADLNTRKSCWVSWKKVMSTKDNGGLGVSIIKALHGEDDRIGSNSNTPYSSIWLSIIHEVEILKDKGIDLPRFITPYLGIMALLLSFGSPMVWLEVAFKFLAPRIYILETMKDITNASKLFHNDLGMSLRRKPRDGIELAQLELLYKCLEGISLSNSNDRWSWNLDGTGEFSVASVRKHIDEVLLPDSSKKTRWIKEVPIKINVHAWKVSNNGLPTRFNISGRGMEIESIICPMCGDYAESTSHLFFSCKVVCDVMRKVTRWWEMEYKDIHSYEEWLDWLLSIRLSLKRKQVFEGIKQKKGGTFEPEENTFFHISGGKRAFIKAGEGQELLKQLQEPGNKHTLPAYLTNNSIRLKAAQLQKAHCTWESLDVLLHKAVSYSPQDEVLWLMVAKEKWLADDVLARHILQELYPAIYDSEEIWLVVFKLEFENNKPVKREGRECV